MEVKNRYSARAEERRRQFNRLISTMDMILMNNIPEADPSVFENWQTKSPMGNDYCEYEEDGTDTDGTKWYHCYIHDTLAPSEDAPCEGYEEDSEVYQWYAVSDNSADFLKRHNQYVTYSDLLDTYFLAICHFGTPWDYVDSMVEDFADCYHGLDKFEDNAK